VSNEGGTSTSDLVPQTSSTPPSAGIPERHASTSLTLNRERIAGDSNSVSALIVIRRKNLRGGKIEDTSAVEETSDIDVISDILLSGESHTALPLIATIIIHSNAIVDITVLVSIARFEDKDDRIHRSTLIASIENDSLALTLESEPDTPRAVFIGATLDLGGIGGASIHSIVKLTNLEINTLSTSGLTGTSKGSNSQSAQCSQKQCKFVHPFKLN